MLFLFLGFLLRVVEPNFALQDRAMRPVVGRPLLVVFLRLQEFLFVRRFDDAPAASPGDAGAKSYAHPFLDWLPCPFHDDVDVVQCFSLAGDQSACVSLLERRVFKHGKPYPRRPLDQRMVRVEVEQVPVAASSANAQDILKRLLVVGFCRKRFDLLPC
jgi:hypothetical protein